MSIEERKNTQRKKNVRFSACALLVASGPKRTAVPSNMSQSKCVQTQRNYLEFLLSMNGLDILSAGCFVSTVLLFGFVRSTKTPNEHSLTHKISLYLSVWCLTVSRFNLSETKYVWHSMGKNFYDRLLRTIIHIVRRFTTDTHTSPTIRNEDTNSNVQKYFYDLQWNVYRELKLHSFALKYCIAIFSSTFARMLHALFDAHRIDRYNLDIHVGNWCTKIQIEWKKNSRS